VAITVAELVADPLLKLRFLAGEGGGARLVTWAHTSDLPNPTEWLGPGDFLMSNGLNISRDASAQVSFLESVVAAGLSGLGIGDDVHAPPLTATLLARADELEFPLLGIPHEVPFVAVSRAVANANSDEEHSRLLRTVQLYEVLRCAVSRGRLGAGLLRELEGQLGCVLAVLDAATGLPVLPSDHPPPPGLAERVREELNARHGVFPGVLRVEHEESVACVIRVPAERPVALVALANGKPVPELGLLQHAANIAALEVERVNAEQGHAWRLGSELMAHLLERRLDPASALRQLREHGIDPERVVLVALRPDAAIAERDLHHELAARGLVHLVLWNAGHTLVAIPDSEEALEGLRAALGAELALGVSDPLRRSDRVPDAAREARWAETAARSLGGGVARYGDATPLFLPRTIGEAETAAERVMGAVIAYDEEHGTDLVRSLSVFLDHNRSWQRSSQVLHVHKQTLVYRMRRVEELTGRSLREMADVVELWLGLRALDFAHGEPVGQSGAEVPEPGLSQ
jgi:PucR family transcriptional regulator, purine catabolism regulatory protein